jgi:hypothetical protein
MFGWFRRRSSELELAAELHCSHGQTRITIRVSGARLEELLAIISKCEQHIEATRPEVHIA